MQAHRQHVYQRLTSDLDIPHLLVAEVVSGLALVCGLYIGAPRIIPGVGHRRAPTAGRPG